MTITLEVHSKSGQHKYLAKFATEAQALTFVKGREITHSFVELDEHRIEPDATELLEWLYPECEHHLSKSNCFGPQHYYYDEEEQARGLYNS